MSAADIRTECYCLIKKTFVLKNQTSQILSPTFMMFAKILLVKLKVKHIKKELDIHVKRY